MAEYDRELDLLHKRLDTLDQRMAEGFLQLTEKIAGLAETRSFVKGYARGVVSAVGLVAGAVGSVLGLIVNYLISVLWSK